LVTILEMVNLIKTPIPIEAEKLAGWYFRLNGCLTIPNFNIHEDAGIGQRREIDISDLPDRFGGTLM